MTRAIIEDWDGFTAFLAAQPLCQWSAQKQRDVASGKLPSKGHAAQQGAAALDDNAALVAALSSMA
jgi:hypothetical protein